MKEKIIEKVLRRLRLLEGERRSWEGHWQEIAELMLPAKGDFNLGNQGHRNGYKRNNKIVDSTALYALRILAAGMHGGLSSPARPWFRLSLKERALEDIQGVRYWLQDTQDRVHAVLASSNFYPTVHAHYAELAAFGTGVFLIEDDDREVIRCRNLTIGEYYLDCDSRGRVDTLYRRFYLSAKQMVERFGREAEGGTCPRSIEIQAKEQSDARYELIHAIEPREYYDVEVDDEKNRPFASYYVLVGANRVLLEESGYEEFPACCPRWDVTGSSVYGRGPGMDALPDVAMLQRMRADGLDALELEIKPPMNVSNSIRNQGGQFALRPGYANFVDTNSPAPAITPTYQVKANLQALDSYLQQIRKQIGEHFYKDLFLLLSQTDKSMTATEVNERNAEKLLMLGPTLERLRSELFQPLIQRVLGLMKRYGHISPVPEVLQGQEWEIVMESTLALAQKNSDIGAIKEISSYAGALAGVKPEVLDNLDTDEMLLHTAKLMGVPPAILRGKDFVANLRAQRGAEEEQMRTKSQQIDFVDKSVDVVTKLSDVDLDKNTLAREVVGGVGNLVGQILPTGEQGLPQGMSQTIPQEMAQGMPQEMSEATPEATEEDVLASDEDSLAMVQDVNNLDQI